MNSIVLAIIGVLITSMIGSALWYRGRVSTVLNVVATSVIVSCLYLYL